MGRRARESSAGARILDAVRPFAALAGLEAPEILPIAALDVGPRGARALGCGPIEGRDGKWSAKEVLGHLVDSASVNHQRFVRALFSEDLVFEGYEQDAWVGAQRYGDAPWAALVTLWSAFNLHLARVIAAMPATARTRTRTRHNLDALAWQPISADAPATLDAFMADYVGHLEHHLRQAFAAAGEALRP